MKIEVDAIINFVAKPEGGNPAIIALLGEILTEIKKMAVALDELNAKVTALESVSDSAVTLLTGLKAKLDEAIASGDPAAVQALSDRLGADTQKLADAVTANTPAE